MEQETRAAIIKEESTAPPPYDQPQRYGQTGIYFQPQGYGQPQGYVQPGGNDQTQEYVKSQGYGQPAGPEIITTQTNVAYATPGTFVVTSSERPPDRTVLAWLVCLCCFWPTGICAIMYANEASRAVDNNEAWRQFRLARIFIIVSFVCGLIAIALAIWRAVYAMNSYYSY